MMTTGVSFFFAQSRARCVCLVGQNNLHQSTSNDTPRARARHCMARRAQGGLLFFESLPNQKTTLICEMSGFVPPRPSPQKKPSAPTRPPEQTPPATILLAGAFRRTHGSRPTVVPPFVCVCVCVYCGMSLSPCRAWRVCVARVYRPCAKERRTTAIRSRPGVSCPFPFLFHSIPSAPPVFFKRVAYSRAPWDRPAVFLPSSTLFPNFIFEREAKHERGRGWSRVHAGRGEFAASAIQ